MLFRSSDRVSVPTERFDLRLGAFPRQGTLQGVRVLQDYEPLSSRRLGAFLSAVMGLPPPREDAFPPFNGSVRGTQWITRPDLLDLVAVRGIVTADDTLASAGVPGWERVAHARDLGTYRNDRALPRAYVVERARFVPDEDAALAVVVDRAFAPRSEAVLDRKSTRLNSSHIQKSRMPSSA